VRCSKTTVQLSPLLPLSSSFASLVPSTRLTCSSPTTSFTPLDHSSLVLILLNLQFQSVSDMSGLVLPTASTSRASSTGAPISLPGQQQQGNKGINGQAGGGGEVAVNGNGNGAEASGQDKDKGKAVDKDEIIPGVQGIVPTLQ